MRLVVLRRVSSAEQANDDRAGLARQEHETGRIVERLGASVLASFTVVDVSRPNVRATPAWAEITRLIEAPDVHIAVDRLDRLVGDLEGAAILETLRRTGTRVYTSNGDYDLATSAGRLLGMIQGLVAGDELEAIRHRVQGAKESKRRAGQFPNSANCLPTGVTFTRVRGGPGVWGFSDDIRKVQRAFAAVIGGELNAEKIARDTGLSSGKLVRLILGNPIYSGVWEVSEKRQAGVAPIGPDGKRRDRKKVQREPGDIIRTEVFRPRGVPCAPGDMRAEAAVTCTEFDHVQRLLVDKSEGYYARREPRDASRFTYTGLLECSYCHNRLMSKTRKGDGNAARRDYYVCPRTQMVGERCTLKYLRRDMVHEGVDMMIARTITSPDFIDALFARKDRDTEAVENLRRAKATLEKANAKRGRLVDLYLAGEFDRATLDARRLAIDLEIANAERDVRGLTATLDVAASAAADSQLRDVILALAEYEFWTGAQKRSVSKKVFRRISVSEVGIVSIDVMLPPNANVGGHVVPAPGPFTRTVAVDKPWPTVF